MSFTSAPQYETAEACGCSVRRQRSFGGSTLHDMHCLLEAGAATLRARLQEEAVLAQGYSMLAEQLVMAKVLPPTVPVSVMSGVAAAAEVLPGWETTSSLGILTVCGQVQLRFSRKTSRKPQAYTRSAAQLIKPSSQQWQSGCFEVKRSHQRHPPGHRRIWHVLGSQCVPCP